MSKAHLTQPQKLIILGDVRCEIKPNPLKLKELLDIGFEICDVRHGRQTQKPTPQNSKLKKPSITQNCRPC